jgi:AraC-like DNA-binding protein
MPAYGAAAPLVIAYAPRERTRALIKRLLGKPPGHLALARAAGEFSAMFRRQLVDAALVDVAASDGADAAAALSLEYPSVAFVGVTPFRPSDGPSVARCAELDFADVLVEGVDNGMARRVVSVRGYSGRFAGALHDPPASLSLSSALHLAAWHFIVARAGRPIRTSALASSLGVTREHLSRSFGAGGAPTLKRLIDLVRLLSAAELAKNPGYDVADVARVLGFSSSAHLSLTAQRLIGRRASSLAALRGVDVIERFAREQSDGAGGSGRLARGAARGTRGRR